MHFTPLFRPLRHNTIAPLQVRDAMGLINAFRAFLGAERLKRASVDYSDRAVQEDDIHVIRMRENQPLIDGFIAFDKATFCGRRPLKRLAPEVAELAHIAQVARLVEPSLDAGTREEHITKLLSLDGQLRPLLLEWKTAAQIARHKGAQIAWVPSGQKTVPEFVARIGEVEFDVECKRPTPMVVQRLGDSEADALAASIMRGVREQGLQGRMTLEVVDGVINKSGGLAADIVTPLLDSLKSGGIDVSLPSGVRLSGILVPSANQPLHRDDWLADTRIWQSRLSNARAYSSGKANGCLVENPITLMLTAPQKSPDHISKDLWERKFKKAAGQCTGQRGAIIVFEWASIDDPTLFRDVAVFSELAARTFKEFPHVARIVMRCDTAPEREHGLVHFDAKIYTVENRAPTYPEVVPFLDIEAPLER